MYMIPAGQFSPTWAFFRSIDSISGMFSDGSDCWKFVGDEIDTSGGHPVGKAAVEAF